jgi:2-oxoglutarate ferredoxin oxidoreductase subunit beta
VQGALGHALEQLAIPAHQTLILAGIGCSGTIQNNLGTYGYHAMHGRVLPSAIGAALMNPSLTIIAAGGDGDGYAIGAGHLVHSFRRNPNIVYIVMNNGTYGLTKGQDSPTAEHPYHTGEGVLDAVSLGLSIYTSSFIARGFTSRPAQLNGLMLQALEHTRARRGMAFIEVLSPCVTYNDTYPEWDARVEDVDTRENYDCMNRETAMTTVLRLHREGRIPIGLIYKGEARTLEENYLKDIGEPPALKNFGDGKRKQQVREILAGYGFK